MSLKEQAHSAAKILIVSGRCEKGDSLVEGTSSALQNRLSNRSQRIRLWSFTGTAS